MRLLFSLLSFVVAITLAAEERSYKYYPNMQYAVADPRLFFSTTTTSSTSVITVTCMKKTASVCAGRRRRGILEVEEDEEQFAIAPSTVQGAEVTQEPIRDTRAADPQLLVMAPSFDYPQHAYYDVGLPYGYRPAVAPHYYGGYGYHGVNDRLFFNLITVTSTSTVFSITTSTSTTICSPATGFTIAECPA